MNSRGPQSSNVDIALTTASWPRPLLVGLWLLLFSVGSTGCSSSGGTGGRDCELDARDDFVFDRVVLVEGISSQQCPELTPQQLNASVADAGTVTCRLSERNCALIVECDLAGVTGGGALAFDDGTVTGRLRVERPVRCEYDVRANVRE